jgi:hypothetical protein
MSSISIPEDSSDTKLCRGAVGHPEESHQGNARRPGAQAFKAGRTPPKSGSPPPTLQVQADLRVNTTASTSAMASAVCPSRDVTDDQVCVLPVPPSTHACTLPDS